MKDRHEALERVRGLFNITVTTFDAAGELDLKGVTETCERVLGMGYDGLLIGGTYGEFATMTPAERDRLFGHVMEVVDDRAPVLLCAAHSDPRIVADLARRAAELGGLPMVTPPYVTEVTDAQVVAFFEKIAPLSRTGLMIYNAPGVGVTLSAPLIERLAGIEGVVALKQGDLNPGVVDRLASTLAGRIRVLAASDLVFLGPLAAGFDGFSSTNSCAFPEIVLETYQAFRAGDAARAGALHRSWYGFRALARAIGQPQTTKAAMALRGWRGGRPRPPLLELTDEEVGRLRDAMAEMERETGRSLLAGTA